MFYVVQPYGRSSEYEKATVILALPTAAAAWEYVDSVQARMAAMTIPSNFVSLVVVNDQRQAVPRPTLMVN